MEKGVDLSKWNKIVDFNLLKEEVEFVILRASYGYDSSEFINRGVDDSFEENYRKAKEAKLKVGAYHYSYARNKEEARLELKHFLNKIKGKTFEYPLIYDIEDEKVLGRLAREKLTDIANEFLTGLEKSGYYSMIYSSKYWLENKLDMDRLSRFDTWLAEWREKASYKKPYGIWQYSSTSKVKGVERLVDSNYSYKDYEKIIKEVGLNGFTKIAKKDVSKNIEVIYSNELDLFAASIYAKFNNLSLKFMESEPKHPYIHIGYSDKFKNKIYGETRLDTLKAVLKEIKK